MHQEMVSDLGFWNAGQAHQTQYTAEADITHSPEGIWVVIAAHQLTGDCKAHATAGPLMGLYAGSPQASGAVTADLPWIHGSANN